MQTCLVLDTNVHLVSQHVTTLRGKLVVHQMWKCKSNFNSSTSIVYTSKLKFVGLDCTSPSRKSVPIDSSALNNKSNNLNQSSIQSSNISVHRPSFSQLLPDARSSFHLSGCKWFHFLVGPWQGICTQVDVGCGLASCNVAFFCLAQLPLGLSCLTSGSSEDTKTPQF